MAPRGPSKVRNFVHLDVMAWDLFVVAFCVDFSHARSARQPAHAIALEDSADACFGNCDVVIAREIPDDADRPEVIRAAQMQDLVGDLRRCPVDRILGDRLGVDEPGFAEF